MSEAKFVEAFNVGDDRTFLVYNVSQLDVDPLIAFINDQYVGGRLGIVDHVNFVRYSGRLIIRFTVSSTESEVVRFICESVWSMRRSVFFTVEHTPFWKDGDDEFPTSNCWRVRVYMNGHSFIADRAHPTIAAAQKRADTLTKQFGSIHQIYNHGGFQGGA